MALLEILMRPLLNAQREAGIEIGREEGKAEGEVQGRSRANAEFEVWKERQRAAGVEFVDDDDEPESDQSPAHDQ